MQASLSTAQEQKQRSVKCTQNSKDESLCYFYDIYLFKHRRQRAEATDMQVKSVQRTYS